MLGEQQGEVLLLGDAGEQLDALVCLLRAHAGGRLVEQQHARPACQHYAEFYLLLRAVADLTGDRICDVVERKVFDHLPGLGPMLALRHAPHVEALAAVGDEACLDILEDRELGEDVGALERAAYAHRADFVRRHAGDVPSIQDYLAAIGVEVPGDQVEQSRFAGAVGSNDRGDGVLLHGEVDVVGSDEAGEGLAQFAAFQHQARAPSSKRPRRASTASAPATPPGDANSRTSSTKPSTNGQNSV